jgi:hypothetical protein
MAKKNDRLEALHKNVQAEPAAKPSKRGRLKRPPETRKGPRLEPTAPAHESTGKPVGFWGDDEDRRILREFARVLFEARFKASESLAIRAALRLVRRENRAADLVEQARAVVERDGRPRRHEKKAA